MTMPCRAHVLAAALCTSMLVGACGNDDESAATTTAPAETTTTADPQAALETEIIAAYETQWADFLRAGDPPNPDAEFLANHQTGRVLQGTLNVLRQYQAEGVAIRGRYEFDADVTEVTDTTAVVQDCFLDLTQVVRIDTGEVVEDVDTDADGLVVAMVLEDGSWKVSTFERDPQVCA